MRIGPGARNQNNTQDETRLKKQHHLLRRQLERLALRIDRPPDPEQWGRFLELVDEAYRHADGDRTDPGAPGRGGEEHFRALTRLSADWYREQDSEFRFVSLCGVDREPCLPLDQQIGRRRWELPGAHATEAEWRQHRGGLERHEPFRDFVYRHSLSDGSHCWVSVSGEPCFDAQGGFTGYRGVTRDVTAEKLAQRAAYELAHYDALTGLFNRTMLAGLLERALARARRHGRPLAVLFVDLDGFKQINDTLGHAVGDVVLQVVARRLRDAVRSEDALARLGGDEFLVILEDYAGAAPDDAVRRLLATLAQPMFMEGRELRLSASIGVATFPGDSADADTLVRQADMAMYRVKASGGSDHGYFSPELQRSAFERMQLGTDLRRAMQAGQIRILWQPKIATASGRVTGAEALLRWQHPQRGAVDPAQFISIAEETGLAIPIGRWLIGEVCRQGRAWMDAGMPLAVSVNMSLRQFRDSEMLDDIRCALDSSGLDPRLLELELTEHMVMNDAERVTGLLHELRRLGVRLALDRFGTGHSSLMWLRRLPFDTVKIDRTFVGDLPDDVEVTRAVIALAHSLHRVVVGVGVEHARQEHMLRELGCDEIQGHFVSRPVSAQALRAFVERRPPVRPAKLTGA